MAADATGGYAAGYDASGGYAGYDATGYSAGGYDASGGYAADGTYDYSQQQPQYYTGGGQPAWESNPAEWSRCFDEPSGHYFWVNNTTGESLWEQQE